MKYQKYYFATGNKQKLARLQKLFGQIDSSIIIEAVPDCIDVHENGMTSEENALQKIEPYIQKYDCPVLAEDTAVFFEGMKFDPTHVKRITLQNAGIDEQTASQEEVYQAMLHYYQNLATSKGGEFDFYYEDGWAILFPDGNIHTFSYQRKYTMTEISVGEPQLYFPMCNLYKSRMTGKHYMEWNEDDYIREFQVQIDAMKEHLGL